MTMQINKWVGMTVFLGALVVETAGTRAIGIAQNPPDRSAPLASPRLFKQINPTILHQAPMTEAPRMFIKPINPINFYGWRFMGLDGLRAEQQGCDSFSFPS